MYADNPLTVDVLRKQDLEDTLDLFCTCFYQDSYYEKMFLNGDTRTENMRESFSESIDYCIECGSSLGVRRDGKLIAFLLSFEYGSTRAEHPLVFRKIFMGARANEDGELPYEDSLHRQIENSTSDSMYCLSVAVHPDFRRFGIASGLIDRLMQMHPDHNIIGDVSNPGSLAIYKKRSFEITELDEEYYMVFWKANRPLEPPPMLDTVEVVLPDTDVLIRNDIAFDIIKEQTAIFGFDVVESCGIRCFCENRETVRVGVLVELAYEELLKYQRAINVTQCREHTVGQAFLYSLDTPYHCPPLMNETLEALLVNRQSEWSLVTDVYVSIPMQYQDSEWIRQNSVVGGGNVEMLLKDLDFRTHYEAGIPSSAENVDDLADFKRRIKRFYLGKVLVGISSEITVDNYAEAGEPIGVDAYVDLYVSVDIKSNCAVLSWFSLSCPFLLSHLMDNVIQNQLMVSDGGKRVNFFNYLSDKFKVKKSGTPKIFVVIPKDKGVLKPSQIASLLASETIYPDGEEYGVIVDSEIMSPVTSEQGMGQYDRAFVCAYSNVLLQFNAAFKGTLSERMQEESIPLFYIELILFEEAAIHIADRSIKMMLSYDDMTDPIEFLERVDKIHDEYARSIEFWDLQMNYPTSQRSVNMLRTAFKVKDQLDFMKRNQEQLQVSFDTKCDLADRRESKRMNTSLTIISILAVFSAWMDGHQYVAAWNDVFSEDVIRILQKVIFAAIAIVAGYAVVHLFFKKTPKRRRPSKGSRDGGPKQKSKNEEQRL